MRYELNRLICSKARIETVFLYPLKLLMVWNKFILGLLDPDRINTELDGPENNSILDILSRQHKGLLQTTPTVTMPNGLVFGFTRTNPSL